MTRVKNLTNSPYDLPTTDGTVRLPAFGEANGRFEPEYLELLQASMAVEVLDDNTPPPLPQSKAKKTEQLPGLPPMPVDTTGDGVPELPPAPDRQAVIPGLPPLPGA